MDDAYDLIATVRKNASDEVRIALSEFRGTSLIDMRVFSDFDGSGERRPTKKGLALSVTRLPDLIDALQLAKAEAERRGLMP